MPTPIGSLTRLCREVEAESGRKRKVELTAAFLRSLGRDEVRPAVLILLAQALPETEKGGLDVGYRTIRRALAGGQQRLFAAEEEVSIVEVSATLKRIAEAQGAGSRKVKENLLAGLLSRLDEEEREYLLRSLYGEMRIGMNEGVMLEAIARASGASLETVRNANMLSGDIGNVAAVALADGEGALGKVGVGLFTPIRPMLAEMSEGVEDALRILGEAAFEFKLDGARIQIHRDHDVVRIFSRRLTDVTESLPEIVGLARTRVKAERFILEGEAVAFKDRPMPFQDVMRRMTRVHGIADASELVPIRLFLFDALYVDWRTLIDLPYRLRWQELNAIVPSELVVPRLVSSDRAEVDAFYQRALSEGHEGLVAKDLESPYTVGKRGKRWLKIKKSSSLDLVIVAADWGYGRRTGWLSDYYLAAVSGDSFEVIGKTYKGFTDEEFVEITRRLLELKTGEDRHTVKVRPEIVVEVVFDEVQRSPRYPSGFALRLARIKSIRDDKPPAEADTLDSVRRVFEEQFRTKARLEGGGGSGSNSII